jgi:uncharacterized caspase-like protein
MGDDMNRTWLLVALLFSLAVSSGPPALAEQRLALLIGNKKYQPAVGPLQNPHNDVDLVGKSLETLGFKLTVLKDADYAGMHKAVKAFIAEARGAGPQTVTFLYYSGHGAVDPKTQINYLIPVDVQTAADTSIWQNSVELKADIVDKLAGQAPDALPHWIDIKR